MTKEGKSFSAPLQKEHIRIVLKIDGILSEVENSAPDFVSPKKDTPKLLITPTKDMSAYTNVFTESYALDLNNKESEKGLLRWELSGSDIWFDIPMDAAKEIWVSEFSFVMESATPRYIAYHIKDVSHHLMWLQESEDTQKIQVLSDFKKSFEPAALSGNQYFSGSEILMCCDMLGRGIQKIDPRTGSALVKFNTEKGRLCALLQGMAERLGYIIEPLDEEIIQKQQEAGENVSHLISLK